MALSRIPLSSVRIAGRNCHRPLERQLPGLLSDNLFQSEARLLGFYRAASLRFDSAVQSTPVVRE
jgi:hypothetical protein